MKLRSYKTIQWMVVVFSASALIIACHTKATEPLKLMPGHGGNTNQTTLPSGTTTITENYGVPQAQNVLFGSNAQEISQDLTY